MLGDSVKSGSWTNSPDYEETKNAFIAVGRIKAQIDLLEIEIDEIERAIKRGSRKADVVDIAKEASATKRRELAELKSQLRIAEYELEFLQFRKDIYKSLLYSSK